MPRRDFLKLGAAGLAGVGALSMLPSMPAGAQAPGAPTYTILRVGLNFIARNDSGMDEFTSPSLHLVLQYAINSLPLAGGSIVLKPSINDPATQVAEIAGTVIWPVNKPVVFMGESEDITLQPQLTANPMFLLDGSGWQDSQGVRGCIWANFRIDCSRLAAGGRAIDGDYVFNFIFDHIEILNLVGAGKRGISLKAGQIGSFRSIKANNGNSSLGITGGLVYLEPDLGNNGSNMGFYDCVFGTGGPTDQGVFIRPYQIAFFQCHFADTRVVTGDAGKALNFYSCEWERATLEVQAGNHVSLIGCDFAGNVGSTVSAIRVGTMGDSSITRLSLVGCVFGRSGNDLNGESVVDVSNRNCRVDMIGCLDTFVAAPLFWKGLTEPGNVLRQSGGQVERAITRVANQGTAIFSQVGPPIKRFYIPHGLAVNPDAGIAPAITGTILVTAGSPDARGPFWVTADATYIYVHYVTEPPAGFDNIILRWSVSVQ